MNKEDGERILLSPWLIEEIEDLAVSKILVAATMIGDGAKSGERSDKGSCIEGLYDYQQTEKNNSSSHWYSTTYIAACKQPRPWPPPDITFCGHMYHSLR